MKKAFFCLIGALMLWITQASPPLVQNMHEYNDQATPQPAGIPTIAGNIATASLASAGPANVEVGTFFNPQDAGTPASPYSSEHHISWLSETLEKGKNFSAIPQPAGIPTIAGNIATASLASAGPASYALFKSVTVV